MRPVFYQRRLTPNLGISGKWIYRILLALVVAFVVHRAYVLGKGVLDASESARLSESAEAELQAGRAREAMTRLKSAVTLDPENTRALRLMARLLDLEGSPQALEFHRLLEASGETGAEDWRLMALSAARHGQLERALYAAHAYRRGSGDAAFPHLVESLARGAAGDSVAQERALRAAIAEREDAETLGALADFLLSDPEILDLNATEISRLLRRVASIDPGASGLGALRTGLASGILHGEDFGEWLELYRSHPAATAATRIDAAGLEIGRNPATAPRVMGRLLDSLANASFAERVDAARWFLDRGNPAAAQGVLPLEIARADRDALGLWLESAAALGQWSLLEGELVQPSSVLPDSTRLPVLARALKEQGREAEAADLRNEALSRFRGDPGAFSDVLRNLLAAGEWELFEKNLTVLSNDPLQGAEALKRLVPVARSHRDSMRLLALYEKSVRNPVLAQDPFVLDRLQFNRLVLGKPVAIEDVEFRLRQAGDNPDFLVTAALGMLVNGLKAKSLHLLEEGPVSLDPDRLEPRQRAVFAAVLAANGRNEEALRMAAGIPRRLLTREEEAFLDAALAD